ncbi:MAG: hypothetical protein JSV04_04295, partial [Candidatus Heimdallarchaeota archaeon]
VIIFNIQYTNASFYLSSLWFIPLAKVFLPTIPLLKFLDFYCIYEYLLDTHNEEITSLYQIRITQVL